MVEVSGWDRYSTNKAPPEKTQMKRSTDTIHMKHFSVGFSPAIDLVVVLIAPKEEFFKEEVFNARFHFSQNVMENGVCSNLWNLRPIFLIFGA